MTGKHNKPPCEFNQNNKVAYTNSLCPKKPDSKTDLNRVIFLHFTDRKISSYYTSFLYKHIIPLYSLMPYRHLLPPHQIKHHVPFFHSPMQFVQYVLLLVRASS